MKNVNQQHNNQNTKSHWQMVGSVVVGGKMNKGGNKQKQNKNPLGDFNH